MLPRSTAVFVAAWFVVLYHVRLGAVSALPPPVVAVLGKGYLAVDLFFMLSGFVLWLNYAHRLRGGGIGDHGVGGSDRSGSVLGAGRDRNVRISNHAGQLNVSMLISPTTTAAGSVGNEATQTPPARIRQSRISRTKAWIRVMR